MSNLKHPQNTSLPFFAFGQYEPLDNLISFGSCQTVKQ